MTHDYEIQDLDDIPLDDEPTSTSTQKTPRTRYKADIKSEFFREFFKVYHGNYWTNKGYSAEKSPQWYALIKVLLEAPSHIFCFFSKVDRDPESRKATNEVIGRELDYESYQGIKRIDLEQDILETFAQKQSQNNTIDMSPTF